MERPPLDLGNGVTLPACALTLRASQSGGPGGQHVNKTSSQIEVRLDIANCESLPEAVRRRLLRVLAPRLTKAGELVVSCSTHRSQLLNRRDGILRVEAILREALRPRKKRRATRPTRASRKRRLDSKRRKSQTKSLRRRPGRDD
ncbi:MAG: alternative ribosome rescue aminoacyl-tRNA hydrolase ArfB [Planctomycetota bacterium]|jgi:ribosome-associated protein